MAGEYIFTMSGLNRSYGHKVILKDIHLSFYHGAKIGIVGKTGKDIQLRGCCTLHDGWASPFVNSFEIVPYFVVVVFK